jgi:hypothetical protein
MVILRTRDYYKDDQGSHTFYRIDVRCYWPQKKPKKNSRMRIKKMEAIDAIPDLMLEVGLDGNY